MLKDSFVLQDNIVKVSEKVNFDKFLEDFALFLKDNNISELAFDFSQRVIQESAFIKFQKVLKYFNVKLIGIYSYSPITKMLFAENGYNILSEGSLIHTKRKSFSSFNSKVKKNVRTSQHKQDSSLKRYRNSKEDNTLFIYNTIRSGVKIEYPDSIVIVGDVNPGAEIVAGGDVYVFGKLLGYVKAGIPDDTKAIIVASYMQPPQITIAGIKGIYEAEDEESKKNQVAYLGEDEYIFVTNYDNFISYYKDNNKQKN